MICILGCQTASKKKSAETPGHTSGEKAPAAKGPEFGAETPEAFGQLFCDFNMAPDVDKFVAMAHPKLLDILLTSMGQAKGSGKPYTLDDMKRDMQQQLQTEKPYAACEIAGVKQGQCNEDAVAGYDKELGITLEACGALSADMTGPDGNAGAHSIPILKIQGRWVLDLLGSSKNEQSIAK